MSPAQSAGGAHGCAPVRSAGDRCGFIASASVRRNGFGYFCLNKSNPRDSAEAFDLAEQGATSMDSRLRGNDGTNLPVAVAVAVAVGVAVAVARLALGVGILILRDLKLAEHRRPSGPKRCPCLEAQRVWAPMRLSSHRQASGAMVFGYFLRNKSDPRDSAEAFDLAKQRATSMDSRLRGNDGSSVAVAVLYMMAPSHRQASAAMGFDYFLP